MQRMWTIVTLAAGVVLGATVHAAFAHPSGVVIEPKPAPSSYSRYRKLDLFARALSTIEQHYVRPVDDERLVYAAVRGLVAELDPHSEFLDPDESRLLREEIEGAFGGVGMVVTLEQDPLGRSALRVRDVLPRGPAARADVRVGDRIVAIADRSLGQFSDLQAAILAMRGEPGTTIRFTVISNGRERTISVRRELIDPPAVEARHLGEGFVVLKLREFPEGSARELAEALARLGTQSHTRAPKGLVLDLRDNGGGLLDQAIAVADLFLDEGVIVRTRGRQRTLLDEARASRPGTFAPVPLAVLVNKASASAAEIVAGALQDHRRALIVGERTYGKGSVQAPFELGDGSLLKLTIALYYTPDDRLIQASGITPDVTVVAPSGEHLDRDGDSRPGIVPESAQPRHLRPEDFGSLTRVPDRDSPALAATGDDVQLRVAVEHLRSWDRVVPRRKRG